MGRILTGRCVFDVGDVVVLSIEEVQRPIRLRRGELVGGLGRIPLGRSEQNHLAGSDHSRLLFNEPRRLGDIRRQDVDPQGLETIDVKDVDRLPGNLFFIKKLKFKT